MVQQFLSIPGLCMCARVSVCVPVLENTEARKKHLRVCIVNPHEQGYKLYIVSMSLTSGPILNPSTRNYHLTVNMDAHIYVLRKYMC